MRTTRTIGALALATLLVLSVMAPAALGASAQADDEIEVETHDATNVTNQSAELRGEVAGLDNESATVYFTYWVEGDDENATETANATATEDAEFVEELSGLENGTTYVYVAHADVNNTTHSGEEETFTTGAGEESEENETDDAADDEAIDAFGQQVRAFVHGLIEERGDDHRGIGQAVSEFVTSNNPGADKRPDHAGPPEDRGPDAADDKRQGPPEDRGPGADDRGDDDDDEDDEGDDDDEEEETETETATPTETATEA